MISTRPNRTRLSWNLIATVLVATLVALSARADSIRFLVGGKARAAGGFGFKGEADGLTINIYPPVTKGESSEKYAADVKETLDVGLPGQYDTTVETKKNPDDSTYQQITVKPKAGVPNFKSVKTIVPDGKEDPQFPFVSPSLIRSGAALNEFRVDPRGNLYDEPTIWTLSVVAQDGTVEGASSVTAASSITASELLGGLASGLLSEGFAVSLVGGSLNYLGLHGEYFQLERSGLSNFVATLAVAAVPEPSSLLLIGFGLGGIFIGLRHRKRRLSRG